MSILNPNLSFHVKQKEKVIPIAAFTIVAKNKIHATSQTYLPYLRLISEEHFGDELTPHPLSIQIKFQLELF